MIVAVCRLTFLVACVCGMMLHFLYRIASWILAATAFGAWYQYDKKKEREFSDNEVQQWNQEVLRKTHTKSVRDRQ